ncbi:MAG: XRE family transcriptional regulator [Syntrophorhabdales bacterium]|jgi:transcriptional regulator with XRE-family HTH domain
MESAEEKRKAVLADISSKIRRVRLQRGLSMDALAKRAGFTKSYVSQIENQKREPTIGTLVTLAHALGVNVFSIIGGGNLPEEEATPAIVRADERRTVAVPSKASNITYESINYKKEDRLMDAYVLTPPREFSDRPMAHEGQELLFVLKGREEFVYGGRSYILEEGDCCHFDSSTPHYGRSVGEEGSKVLVVFTMKPDK